MNSRSRARTSFLALVAALAFVACSDDDNPTDTNTDTTPPGISSVTAVDVEHIDVVFNEAVTRESAEDESNYSIVESPVPAPAAGGNSGSATGGGLFVSNASLRGDGRTVTLSTSPMLDVDYHLNVMNVEDIHGNVITEQVQKDFPGSIAADNTPPQLVYHKPASGATSVALAEVIEFSFSEPVQSFGFGLVGPGGAVDVQITESENNTHFIGTHDPLQKNTTYTVTVSGVDDFAGNTMTADAEWSFKTTNTDDTTPPTLVSSNPANLATYVNVNTTLSLTFSEAINPNSFQPFFMPEINGTPVWSVDQKTITFTPDVPLAADQQYELRIFPGTVEDLAGNPNTVLYTRVFTTGAALESGSIAGTITGDVNSSTANDPTGAFVAAADAFPFGGGSFTVYGAGTVAGNDTYKVDHLGDGTYFPMCIKDTADDGYLDPFFGDAIGFYGIDVTLLDETPDSVIVTGGNDVAGINFKLYDPTAVWGQVSYNGIYGTESHLVLVGLFEAAGFDPATSQPLTGTEVDWSNTSFYLISSIEVGPIPSGNYFIGAFLDANDSGDYEVGVDPVGLYGGINTPTAVNLANGSDASNVNITLLDPAPGANATAVHWVTKPHAKWLRNLSKAIREADLTQLK